MSISLTGFIEVKFQKQEIHIPAEKFSLEESGDNHIGDGDYQYECLYVYDHKNEFRVMVQLSKLDGVISTHQPILEGDAKIIDNQLDGI